MCFSSAPGQVMNVRAYVYHPILDNDDNITALIVWDALSAAEAGGIVEYYSVRIRDVENNDIVLVSAILFIVVYTYTSNENCIIHVYVYVHRSTCTYKNVSSKFDDGTYYVHAHAYTVSVCEMCVILKVSNPFSY